MELRYLFLCVAGATFSRGVVGQAIVNPLPNELGVNSIIPNCPAFDPFAYMRDHNNCGMFYRCFWGRAVPMSGCTPGLVFSNMLSICVFPNSPWDDCTIPGKVTDPKFLTPQQRCGRGDKVFGHPDECAMYYNCSTPNSHVPTKGDKYLNECDHPLLFNLDTLACEEFANVTCGTRREPKAGCDYYRNRCERAHCRPCKYSFPSCINVTDGIYFDQIRPWTPAFVECKTERTIRTDFCPTQNSITQIFSPDILQCVSIYDVPRQYNGLRPDCTGKQDKLHPEENGRCDVYIQCVKQDYAGYGRCPNGNNFDPVTQSCRPASTFCPPCGNSTGISCPRV